MNVIKSLAACACLVAFSLLAGPFDPQEPTPALHVQTVEGAAGNLIKLSYRDDAGRTRSTELACHYHDASRIDCHPI